MAFRQIRSRSKPPRAVSRSPIQHSRPDVLRKGSDCRQHFPASLRRFFRHFNFRGRDCCAPCASAVDNAFDQALSSQRSPTSVSFHLPPSLPAKRAYRDAKRVAEDARQAVLIRTPDITDSPLGRGRYASNRPILGNVRRRFSTGSASCQNAGPTLTG